MNSIKWIALNILLGISLHLFSQSFAEQTKVEEVYNGESLRYVLNRIQENTGLNFIYGDKLIADLNYSGKLEIELKYDGIQKLLNEYGLSIKQFGKNSLVIFSEEKIIEESKTSQVKAFVVAEKDSLEVKKEYNFTKPILLSKLNLSYPSEALNHNISGNVCLKLFINRIGNVSQVLLDSTSGSVLLDSVTAVYAKGLEFKPAIGNGDSLNVWMTMKFEYSLTN